MSVDPMMPGFEEIHILWTSEGMSCDGDTVSVTAATLPSIEDVVLGAIPGLWAAASGWPTSPASAP